MEDENATAANQEAHHSNVKRANEITLKQIKSGAHVAQQQGHKHAENVYESELGAQEDFGEAAHLLGNNPRQAATSEQQELLMMAMQQEAEDDDDDDDGIRTAAVLANVANVAAPLAVLDDVDDEANVLQQQKLTMQPHSQLDMQKMPDYGDSNKSNNNNSSSSVNIKDSAQNNTAILLVPTSLNATTVPTAAAPLTLIPTKAPTPTATSTAATVTAPVGGNNGSGSGGGGGGGVHADTAHPPEHHYLHFPHPHLHWKGPKPWRFLVRHWPKLSQPAALLAICVGLWIIGYVLLPDYALPHTPIMRMFFLFVGAQIAGLLVTYIHLPDMLGMLFFGVLYTNVGLADFTGYEKLEAFLREFALINIMLLSGLGLDAYAFKKLWLMIFQLTLVPTVVEVAVITVLAHFTLSMPWIWGVLLGLVITAVSPNVVVTVMLKLKEDRLGLNSGIHTLIYAMTSCNDVVAIFMFGVILNVIFSSGQPLLEQILQGPIGIGIGIVYGYVYGIMLTILPAPKTPYVYGLRFVLTVLGGTVAVMGSKAIGYPSAGALGCMTISFFAGIGWNRQQKKLTPEERHANEKATVPARLDLLWKFLKPVSFSLIGKEINFAVLDGKVVGYGLLLVLLGSLFRLAFVYISTYGGDLTRSERAYITISAFPKATVQAALGPIALDFARSLDPADPLQLSLAKTVLVVSVLAIIFTAPLGAVLMLRLAPRWLQHSDSRRSSEGDAATIAAESSGTPIGSVRRNFSKLELNLSKRRNKIQSDHNGLTLAPPTPPPAVARARALGDRGSFGGSVGDVSLHVDAAEGTPTSTRAIHRLV